MSLVRKVYRSCRRGWGSRRGLDTDGPTCGNELSAVTVPPTPETLFPPPHWTNQVPSPMEYRAPPSPSALGDLGRACIALGWPRGPSISQPPWPWRQGCSPRDSPVYWEMWLPPAGGEVRGSIQDSTLSSCAAPTAPAPGLLAVLLTRRLAPSQKFAMTAPSVCDSRSPNPHGSSRTSLGALPSAILSGACLPP